MPNDQLKLIVEADVIASGAKIASQITEIADEVNKKSKKLKLQIEMDKESFSKEVEKIYKTAESSSKKVKIKVFDKVQLEKEGREYLQGVSDKIGGVENLTKRLQDKFGESAKIQIIRDEEIGIIKSFTVSVKDAEDAVKKLNFERAKIGIGRGAQAGFVETKETYSTQGIKQQISDIKSPFDSQAEKQIQRYSSEIGILNEKFKLLGSSTEDVRLKQQNLNDALGELKEAKNIEQQNSAIAKLKLGLQDANKAFRDLIPMESQNEVKKLDITMTAWLSNNTKAAKQFGGTIEELQQKLRSENLTKGQFRDIGQEFRIAAKEADALGLTTDSLSDKFGKMFTKFTEWFTISRVIMETVRVFKEMINTTIELDNQFNSIRMVTGGTAEETKKLMIQYQQLAKEISSTTSEVAASSEEWLRQGRTLEETNSLIKTSQILSKVGMIESKEAADLLTSSINGYGVAVSDAIGIVDKMSAIDVAAATSTQELAKAMAETATGAKLAGIEMDTLLAYIATVSDVTRDSAESIGTMFRNVFSRIQQVRLGSLIDPDSGEDISHVETVLKQYNITLRDSQGIFRDTSVVLGELAEKWKTLETTEKSEISEQFAGCFSSPLARIYRNILISAIKNIR